MRTMRFLVERKATRGVFAIKWQRKTLAVGLLVGRFLMNSLHA